ASRGSALAARACCNATEEEPSCQASPPSLPAPCYPPRRGRRLPEPQSEIVSIAADSPRLPRRPDSGVVIVGFVIILELVVARAAGILGQNSKEVEAIAVL